MNESGVRLVFAEFANGIAARRDLTTAASTDRSGELS
jgi:hypothetical protein